jgi:secreted trypsin-like serine protease
MRQFVIAVVLFALCEARPSINLNHPFARVGGPDISGFVIGGVDAQPGAWPWQLSQQRQSAAGAWSHSCGASLLSSTRALSASHCVDGASASNLRVIAGLHDRSSTQGSQTSNVARYVMHERYNQDAGGSYSNDVAILHLATAISVGGNIQLLSLPPNNNNNFAGTTCTVTGWGRTSSSNTLPNVLQQADIAVISPTECTTRMSNVGGATIWNNHICIFDSTQQRGACNGDSGGPVNCPNGAGGHYVAGIASWVVSNILGNCLTSYPSVYTRTSAYIDWIAVN